MAAMPGDEYQGFVTGSRNEFTFSTQQTEIRRPQGVWGWLGSKRGGGQQQPAALPTTTRALTIAKSRDRDDDKTSTRASITSMSVLRGVSQRVSHVSNFTLGERLFGPSSDLVQLIMREDWALAAMQCTMKPQLAGRLTQKQGFFMGRHDAQVLPIHQACALRPPIDIVRTLVLSYPAGVKAKESSFGRLPLHVACRSGASSDVIDALLAYYPDSAKADDNLKRIPLHYALKNGCERGVLLKLLDSYPEGVRRGDHRGWIPLHVACSVGTDPDMVRLLIEEWPESVITKTHKGSCAVKCLAMNKGHPNVPALEKLLEEENFNINGAKKPEKNQALIEKGHTHEGNLLDLSSASGSGGDDEASMKSDDDHADSVAKNGMDNNNDEWDDFINFRQTEDDLSKEKMADSTTSEVVAAARTLFTESNSDAETAQSISVHAAKFPASKVKVEDNFPTLGVLGKRDELNQVAVENPLAVLEATTYRDKEAMVKKETTPNNSVMESSVPILGLGTPGKSEQEKSFSILEVSARKFGTQAQDGKSPLINSLVVQEKLAGKALKTVEDTTNPLAIFDQSPIEEEFDLKDTADIMAEVFGSHASKCEEDVNADAEDDDNDIGNDANIQDNIICLETDQNGEKPMIDLAIGDNDGSLIDLTT